MPRASLRSVLLICAGGAATWRLAARAQQPAMPVIGLRNAPTADDSLYRVSAFRDGLKEAGLIDGHNVAIDFRWAENKPSAFRDGLKEAGLIDGHNVAIDFRWAENKPDRL